MSLTNAVAANTSYEDNAANDTPLPDTSAAPAATETTEAKTRKKREVRPPNSVPETINLGKVTIPAEKADKFRSRLTAEFAALKQKMYDVYANAQKTAGSPAKSIREWGKDNFSVKKGDFVADWVAKYTKVAIEAIEEYATEAQGMTFASAKKKSVKSSLAELQKNTVTYVLTSQVTSAALGVTTVIAAAEEIISQLKTFGEDATKFDFSVVLHDAKVQIDRYADKLPGILEAFDQIVALVPAFTSASSDEEDDDDDDDDDDDLFNDDTKATEETNSATENVANGGGFEE